MEESKRTSSPQRGHQNSANLNKKQSQNFVHLLKENNGIVYLDELKRIYEKEFNTPLKTDGFNGLKHYVSTVFTDKFSIESYGNRYFFTFKGKNFRCFFGHSLQPSTVFHNCEICGKNGDHENCRICEDCEFCICPTCNRQEWKFPDAEVVLQNLTQLTRNKGGKTNVSSLKQEYKKLFQEPLMVGGLLGLQKFFSVHHSQGLRLELRSSSWILETTDVSPQDKTCYFGHNLETSKTHLTCDICAVYHSGSCFICKECEFCVCATCFRHDWTFPDAEPVLQNLSQLAHQKGGRTHFSSLKQEYKRKFQAPLLVGGVLGLQKLLSTHHSQGLELKLEGNQWVLESNKISSQDKLCYFGHCLKLAKTFLNCEICEKYGGDNCLTCEDCEFCVCETCTSKEWTFLHPEMVLQNLRQFAIKKGGRTHLSSLKTEYKKAYQTPLMVGGFLALQKFFFVNSSSGLSLKFFEGGSAWVIESNDFSQQTIKSCLLGHDLHLKKSIDYTIRCICDLCCKSFREGECLFCQCCGFWVCSNCKFMEVDMVPALVFQNLCALVSKKGGRVYYCCLKKEYKREYGKPLTLGNLSGLEQLLFTYDSWGLQLKLEKGEEIFIELGSNLGETTTIEPSQIPRNLNSTKQDQKVVKEISNIEKVSSSVPNAVSKLEEELPLMPPTVVSQDEDIALKMLGSETYSITTMLQSLFSKLLTKKTKFEDVVFSLLKPELGLGLTLSLTQQEKDFTGEQVVVSCIKQDATLEVRNAFSVGDILVEVNGTSPTTVAEVVDVIKHIEPGSPLFFKVRRAILSVHSDNTTQEIEACASEIAKSKIDNIYFMLKDERSHKSSEKVVASERILELESNEQCLLERERDLLASLFDANARVSEMASEKAVARERILELESNEQRLLARERDLLASLFDANAKFLEVEMNHQQFLTKSTILDEDATIAFSQLVNKCNLQGMDENKLSGLENLMLGFLGDIRKAKDQLRIKDMCCVCLDVPKSMLFLPCRHMCVCSACATLLAICPLCKTVISQKIEAFT